MSDADNDGDSDGADFLVWQRQLRSVSVAATADAVPEPASLLLLCIGVATALFGRRRKKAGVDCFSGQRPRRRPTKAPPASSIKIAAPGSGTPTAAAVAGVTLPNCRCHVKKSVPSTC